MAEYMLGGNSYSVTGQGTADGTTPQSVATAGDDNLMMVRLVNLDSSNVLYCGKVGVTSATGHACLPNCEAVRTACRRDGLYVVCASGKTAAYTFMREYA